MSKNANTTRDEAKEQLEEKQFSSFWSLPRLAALVAFIALLAIPYIYNSHQADKKIRQQEKLSGIVDELRSEYITLKSDVVGRNKQSDVAQKLSSRGIEEVTEAPIKVEIEVER